MMNTKNVTSSSSLYTRWKLCYDKKSSANMHTIAAAFYLFEKNKG